MAYCKNCINAVESNLTEVGLYCMMFRSPCGDTIGCSNGVDGKRKAKTNADRIRAMTDEELDRFLSGVHNNVGSGRAKISVWNNSDRPIRIWRTGWLDWLKQECEK